jgi:hypothetical protein
VVAVLKLDDAVWIVVVPLRSSTSSEVLFVDLNAPAKLTTTKIFDDVACGVMSTVTLVIAAYVLEELDHAVEVLADTTCRIRNAPRTSFICAAVKIAPTENDDGRLVGVAIVNP